MLQFIQFVMSTRERMIIVGSILLAFGLAFATVVMFFPQVITRAVSNLLGAVIGGILIVVSPILGPLLIIGIIIAVFKGLMGKASKKG